MSRSPLRHPVSLEKGAMLVSQKYFQLEGDLELLVSILGS